MASHTVNAVSGNHFVDSTSGTPETTMSVGDTIEWVNGDTMEHTVVSDNGDPFGTLTPALNGDLVNNSDTYPYPSPLTTPGDYGYHCDIHGGDPSTKTGMYGIIHVKAIAEDSKY